MPDIGDARRRFREQHRAFERLAAFARDRRAVRLDDGNMTA